MTHITLTAAQATIRYLAAQKMTEEGQEKNLFSGCWAIFGHGNVAGLGEALYHYRDLLPTYRAHNEQAMAHAAIAYAKAKNRRRMMVCTTSIGPGATNMVTAAALAHVNRLPVLLLPGDVFANRRPDPVLQQIEDFGDGTLSANDCFRPVSRYFDRITRPEQILRALPRALSILTDPAECGPVTLAFCQDVQAESYDYPESFFEPRLRHFRQVSADPKELADAAVLLERARKPLIIAGGGVHYGLATQALADFAHRHGVPVAETQAGKGALAWTHPLAVGAIGVTGTAAANRLAAEADIVLAVGTRLQDFTTGSWALFCNLQMQLIQLNVTSYDAHKHQAVPLIADAKAGLVALSRQLADWQSPGEWQALAKNAIREWNAVVDGVTAPANRLLPSDAEVMGAVNRQVTDKDVVVCAAGGLPGEMHKLWRTPRPGGYHLEYGYSCMGYEIAGGLGVRLATPKEGHVFVLVGDGSYLMMNSEIATSVMLGAPLIIVVLDNCGFGCINRLQQACGSAPFNNLFDSTDKTTDVRIDFAAHAAALGAHAEKVASIAALEQALATARERRQTSVIVIDTDPAISTREGGAWWDVAVPAVSRRREVEQAHARYAAAMRNQVVR